LCVITKYNEETTVHFSREQREDGVLNIFFTEFLT